jgi:hypothetical protein
MVPCTPFALAQIGQRHYYFMNIGNGEVIDACRKGNRARFINHSCDPNCETQKWLARGELAIGLFAVKVWPWTVTAAFMIRGAHCFVELHATAQYLYIVCRSPTPPAEQDIALGEELTFDYNFERQGAPN